MCKRLFFLQNVYRHLTKFAQRRPPLHTISFINISAITAQNSESNGFKCIFRSYQYYFWSIFFRCAEIENHTLKLEGFIIHFDSHSYTKTHYGGLDASSFFFQFFVCGSSNDMLLQSVELTFLQGLLCTVHFEVYPIGY